MPLRDALIDVGTHIGESFTNSLKPVQAAMAPIVAKTMATVDPIVAPIEAKVIQQYKSLTGKPADVPAAGCCHGTLGFASPSRAGGREGGSQPALAPRRTAK